MRAAATAGGDGAGGGEPRAREAASPAVRGAILLVLALVIGIVVLQALDGDRADRTAVGGTRSGTEPAPSTLQPGAPAVGGPLRPPTEVKVLAANGTSSRGLAGRVKERLAAAGYNVLTPADTSKKPVETSSVYFVQGYEGEAKVLAQQLQVAPANVKPVPVPPPVEKAGDVNLIVVVGQDKVDAFAPSGSVTTAGRGRSAGSRAGQATTTTKPDTTTSLVP